MSDQEFHLRKLIESLEAENAALRAAIKRLRVAWDSVDSTTLSRERLDEAIIDVLREVPAQFVCDGIVTDVYPVKLEDIVVVPEDKPSDSMLDDCIAELEGENESLKVENAALRADNAATSALVLELRAKEYSERTQAVCLEKENAALRAALIQAEKDMGECVDTGKLPAWSLDCIRAAIDAARAKEQK